MLWIEDLPGVISRLNDETIVDRFTVRTMSFGMVSSPANLVGVSMVGIEPSTEIYLSQIDEALVEGAYFE